MTITMEGVLQAVYELIQDANISGVKQIYRPGKPVVFRQNMPGIVIQPATPSDEIEKVSSDARITDYAIEVHVITEAGYTGMETRVRGDMTDVMNIASAVKEALYESDDLEGVVDELVDISVDHLTPAHSRVRATYRVRELR